MNYFSIVLEQIEIFVVYMLIGIFAVKMHFLDREKLGMLSGCITKILLPLLIFTNTINGTTREQFLSSAVIILLAAVLYLTLYLVAMVLAKLLRIDCKHASLYRACTMFGNCGFMGIPIITALYPEQGGLYIAMYTVIDQLALWTVGMDLTAPVDGTAKLPLAQRVRKMINPATVAILAGVFVVLTGLQLPSIAVTALAKTGAAASPLAMIYLGGVFCYIKIIDYLKLKEVYVTIVVKMLLLPILIYAVLSHIPAVEQNVAVTIGILCALPTMSSVAMMAESQHSDSDYVTGFIFVTTLISIVTLPVVCLAL